MSLYYFSGCSIKLHNIKRPEEALSILNSIDPNIEQYDRCCHYKPQLPSGSTIINSCPGCNRRFSRNYEDINTVSLWEYLADKDIPLPDYGGKIMTLHDSCAVRGKDNIYDAVRLLLKRMNIVIKEPEYNRSNSKCCGLSFNGKISDDELDAYLHKKAADMPADDVVVYCVTCMKHIRTGGKRTHHMIDLIMGEESPQVQVDLKEAIREIQEYIASQA